MRRPNIRWTKDMDEFLCKLRHEGMAFHKIAFLLDVSATSAKERFRKVHPNAPYIYVPHRKAHNFETRAAVVKMKHEGRKLSEIGALLGLRVDQVHGIWWHWRTYEGPRRGAA